MTRLERLARRHAADTAALRNLAYEEGDLALGLLYGAQLDQVRAEWLAKKSETKPTGRRPSRPSQRGLGV